jgi:deoxyribodipyrimidine photo-lyase
VPELRDLPGKKAHRPWEHGFPGPMVDHAHEREVALARHNAIKQP